MTSDGGRRPRRECRIEGDRWWLFDAGRAPSGVGLGYFARGDLGPGDRRVELLPGTEVGELDEDACLRLWEGGSGLTPTERRVSGPDGELWLAQAVGPEWAEGSAAADAVGVRLRCLSAARPVVSARGARLGELSDSDLLALAGG